MKPSIRHTVILAGCALLTSCSGQPRAETPIGETAGADVMTTEATAAEATPAESMTAEVTPADPQTLLLPEGAAKVGQELVAGDAVKLAAVLAEPTKFFEKTIVVEATATAVCQSKGCWMTITDGAGEPIWVRWSSGCGGQYAFPKDAAGRRVLVQGSFYEKEIAPVDAAHLAAESEGVVAEEIQGKTFELNATAFVLLPEARSES